MDIKKLSKEYFEGNQKGLTAKDDFAQFVERRFYQMSWARNQWYQRVQKTFRLWDVFQPWLLEGENFNKAVRFPTLRDVAKAIKDEIMRNPPEAVLEPRYGEKANRAQALEFKVKEIKDNIYEKRVQEDCIGDMIFFGRGVRRVNYYCTKNPDGETLYDDVGTERLDPRNCYFDEKGRYLWDPKKRDIKRDAIFKYVYPYSTFIEKFSQMDDIINLDKVSGVKMNFSSDLVYPTEREAEEQPGTDGLGVIVYEYINQEMGFFGMVANGVTIKEPDEIENPDGRIPVVVYDFERRRDNAWPNSLAELIAPHIYSQDTIFNLELMGLKLDLMPATMVDSDLGYNKKVHKLHPKAVWEMNVPPGKQLNQMVFPFQRATGDANKWNMMNNFIESQMTISSGNDRKALYLNPGELATQTAFKNQTMQKSVNALIFANEIEAEGQMVELMVGYIKEYLTDQIEVKVGDQETKKYRKVKIRGYKSEQGNGGEVKFTPSQGVDSYFDLTKDAVDVNVRVQVKDVRSKIMLQEKKAASLMQFLPVATNLASAASTVDPEVIKKLDFVGMIEQGAEALDMDLKRTIKNTDDANFDLIQREHMAMLLEINVPVPLDETFEGSLEHKKQHERFKYVFRNNKKTNEFTEQWKAMNEKQKACWTKHMDATLQNIKDKVLTDEYEVKKATEEQPELPPVQPIPKGAPVTPPAETAQTPGAGRNLLPSL